MKTVLTPKQIHALQVLQAQDGWLSAAEICDRGVGKTPTGAGIVLQKLLAMGLIDCVRNSGRRDGPSMYKMTVHGCEVLEMELAEREAAAIAELADICLD